MIVISCVSLSVSEEGPQKGFLQEAEETILREVLGCLT
jgi:hypothetical protein